VKATAWILIFSLKMELLNPESKFHCRQCYKTDSYMCPHTMHNYKYIIVFSVQELTFL